MNKIMINFMLCLLLVPAVSMAKSYPRGLVINNDTSSPLDLATDHGDSDFMHFINHGVVPVLKDGAVIPAHTRVRTIEVKDNWEGTLVFRPMRGAGMVSIYWNGANACLSSASGSHCFGKSMTCVGRGGFQCSVVHDVWFKGEVVVLISHTKK